MPSEYAYGEGIYFKVRNPFRAGIMILIFSINTKWDLGRIVYFCLFCLCMYIEGPSWCRACRAMRPMAPPQRERTRALCGRTRREQRADGDGRKRQDRQWRARLCAQPRGGSHTHPHGPRSQRTRRAVAAVRGSAAQGAELLPNLQDAGRAEHPAASVQQGGGLDHERPGGGGYLRHAPGHGEVVPVRSEKPSVGPGQEGAHHAHRRHLAPGRQAV